MSPAVCSSSAACSPSPSSREKERERKRELEREKERNGEREKKRKRETRKKKQVKPNKQKNPNLSVKKRNEKLRASFFSLHPERLKNRAAILSFLSHHHLLLGAAGLDVVALRVPLVPQELGVHPLARLVLVLLGLLDAVAVGLVGLVVGRMVLGLGHGVKLTRVCVKWRAVVVLEKREGEKKKKKRA